MYMHYAKLQCNKVHVRVCVLKHGCGTHMYVITSVCLSSIGWVRLGNNCLIFPVGMFPCRDLRWWCWCWKAIAPVHMNSSDCHTPSQPQALPNPRLLLGDQLYHEAVDTRHINYRNFFTFKTREK